MMKRLFEKIIIKNWKLTPAVIGAVIFGTLVGGVVGQPAAKISSLGGPAGVTAGRLVAAKKLFGIGEQPVLTLKTGPAAVSWWGVGTAYAAEKIRTQVSYGGHDVDVPVQVRPDGQGNYSVKLQATADTKPGKYTVTAAWGSGPDERAIQSFAWGVLSVNTTQPAYTPGESADIQMAVLSSTGQTICDAPLTLKVFAPDGSMTMPVIHNSSQCQGDSYVTVPDYTAAYVAKQVGHYRMVVRLADSDYELESGFDVAASLPFEITRTAPSRLFPPAMYTNTIQVRPTAGFVGTVTEQLPAGFTIFGADGAKVSGTTLEWPVSWQAGQTYMLHYEFKAPMKSPAFYSLNPLKFTSLGKTVYREPRSWQMAGDGVITFIKQTAVNVTTAASTSTTSVTSTAGDTLILFVYIASPTVTLATTNGITDSASNTWTYSTTLGNQNPPYDTTSSTNDAFAMAYTLNAAAITSITINLSASVVFTYNLVEFSNVATSSAVDQSASGHNGSVTSGTTNTIATTNADDLVIGGMATTITTLTLNQSTSAPTSGWTALTSTSTSSNYGAAAYQVMSATGSYKIGYTLGASHPIAYGIMAFKAATAGGGGGGCSSGISFVKQTPVTLSAAATSDNNRAVTSTAGDLLVMFYEINSASATLSSVTDSAGNTWTIPAASPNQNPPQNVSFADTGGIAYALNAAAITSLSVSISASNYFAYSIVEFSHVAAASAVDQSASAANASSTSQTTPTIATVNANDLLIGTLAQNTYTVTLNQASSSPTSGWNALTEVGLGSNKGLADAAYQVVSATGSYDVNWTLSTAISTAVGAIAFKAATPTMAMMMRGGTYFDGCGKEPEFWAQ